MAKYFDSTPDMTRDELVRIVEPHRANHIEERVQSVSLEISDPLVARINVQSLAANRILGCDAGRASVVLQD